MNRFVTLVLLLTPVSLSAQITWISFCSDKNFCFNQGSCTEGNVFLVEKAVTACGSSPIVNYSYKIDLFNDGSTDINSTQDTVNGPFPIGTHEISWKATDNCANIANCTYLFTIKDCLGPGIICISGLTQNVTPGCTVDFGASDFIVNFGDNCTPADELVFGVNKIGAGSGFPTDTTLSFDGCKFGPTQVEVWVKDENDLVNKCFSSVTIQDNDGVCGCTAEIGLQGCARTADSIKLNKFTIRADLTSASLDLFLQKNKTDSCYHESFAGLTTGEDYHVVVRARRTDDPLNNVSTFDLLQTSKHILNIQPFQSVYQRLAADVNASNSVTTFDVVETRKLILGLYDTFPKVPAWRFVRPIADPTNLLSAVKDTYQIALHNLIADTTLTGLDFIGVKMGDTNLSASFTNNNVDDRAPLLLDVEERLLSVGETISIPVRLSEAATLDGWQLALSVDPALARIENVEGLPEENMALSNHEVRALWYDATGKRFAPKETLFYLKIKTIQPASLSEILSLASQKLVSEAYIRVGTGPEQRHAFVLGFGTQQENGAAFFPPRPNPFGDETTFGLLLRQPGTISLEVFDVSGKMVYSQPTESGAGYQSLVLQAVDLPGTGVFFYRVRVSGEVFGGRLVRG